MSEPKFTPGPWFRDTDGTLPIRIFAEDSRWRDSPKTIIAEVGGELIHGTCNYPEDNANAHLIAAAPELYEIAVMALSLAENDGHDGQVEFIRRTLAKARGEAQP